jgi:3-dehydroquinate dehydratase
MFSEPIVELHVSSVQRREEISHHCLISKTPTAVRMGPGPDGRPTAAAAMVRVLVASDARAPRP